jgi:hypothetical protein
MKIGNFDVIILNDLDMNFINNLIKSLDNR